MKNNLGLESYKVVDIIEEEHSVLIYVQPEKETRKCPNCGCRNCYVKDKKERFYRDVEFMGKHAEVAIVSKRFICNDCNNTFYSEITSMDDTFKITTRLKKRIREEGFLNTFTALSLRYGVDEKTIRNVFKEYSEELDKDWKILAPEVLGIDECHLANYARSVFVDVKKKNSKLIEMAKYSKKVTVEKVLKSMHNPNNTKVVTMDMTNTYKHAVQYVLPNATIVIDKFHVLQTVVGATSDAFKLLRTKMEESFENLPKEELIEIKKRYKSLKISVNMFRTNIEDLNAWQTSCLAESIRIYPDFAKAMTLKENFRGMMNKPKNREEAEKSLYNGKKIFLKKMNLNHLEMLLKR